MKKYVAVLLGFSSIMGLGGCTMLLEDTYSSVKVHTVAPVSEDSKVISVENYYELVNSILYFVMEHQEEGVIRLEDYDKELAKTHLTEAVLEVQSDTALGSYAVDGITWELNIILGKLEVTVFIDYNKTPEEYEEIVYVSGNSAIVRTLTQGISDMTSKIVIQNSYGTSSRNGVSQLIHQAISGAASKLVEIPQIQTNFHPKEGDWRLVEFTFTYSLGEELRISRQDNLEGKIEDITSSLWTSSDEEKIYQTLREKLESLAEVSGSGGTPYDVLVLRRGNSRGFAYTYLALCQELGLECRVLEGSLEGEPYYWNQITFSNGDSHHLDVTDVLREEGQVYFSDSEMLALGYDWNPLNAVVGVEYVKGN